MPNAFCWTAGGRVRPMRLSSSHLFAWQPTVYLKEPRTEEEQYYADQFPDMHEYFAGVNTLLEERFAGRDDVLLMGDFFAGYEQGVFFDFVHITETGNGLVAEHIAQHLIDIGYLP